MKFFRALIFAVATVLAGMAAAEDSVPVPVPVPAPEIPASEITLYNFGVKNPECKVWGNSCALCTRAADASTLCSTPGIACTPADVACLEPEAP